MATFHSDPRAGEPAFRSGEAGIPSYGSASYGTSVHDTAGYRTGGYGTADYRYGGSGYGAGRTPPPRGRRGGSTLPVLLGLGAVVALAFSVRATRRERPTRGRGATLIAELNDLLQLDHDAVRSYTVAIDALEDPALRAALVQYRGDHERHIRDLTELVRSFGGRPMELPHVPTGIFKLGAQELGTLAGGDRAVLLAFKSNERQARDKYLRHAEWAHPPVVDDVLRRNAQDEVVHYEWATRELERMGAGPATTAGRVARGFEAVHGATASAIEAGERAAMGAVEKARGA